MERSGLPLKAPGDSGKKNCRFYQRLNIATTCTKSLDPHLPTDLTSANSLITLPLVHFQPVLILVHYSQLHGCEMLPYVDSVTLLGLRRPKAPKGRDAFIDKAAGPIRTARCTNFWFFQMPILLPRVLVRMPGSKHLQLLWWL